MSIIVSLTTTSHRTAVLPYVIDSLLTQSVKADRVILSLSKEPYLLDAGFSQTPMWLERYCRNGLEVKWVKNYGSYRKLFPIIQDIADDDILVTCDDDVIYGSSWLENLLDCANRHSKSIVAGRARKTTRNIFGQKTSYKLWPVVRPGAEGSELTPIGVAGVVYRKSLLELQALEGAPFLHIAPRSDDLWFRHMSLIKNVSVTVAEGVEENIYEIAIPKSTSLNSGDGIFKRDLRHPINYAWELILHYSKAYLGRPVCENDHAMLAIEKMN